MHALWWWYLVMMMSAMVATVSGRRVTVSTYCFAGAACTVFFNGVSIGSGEFINKWSINLNPGTYLLALGGAPWSYAAVIGIDGVYVVQMDTTTVNPWRATINNPDPGWNSNLGYNDSGWGTVDVRCGAVTSLFEMYDGSQFYANP